MKGEVKRKIFPEPGSQSFPDGQSRGIGSIFWRGSRQSLSAVESRRSTNGKLQRKSMRLCRWRQPACARRLIPSRT
jgi:hypothetical protein